jgi:hypothetical protein
VLCTAPSAPDSPTSASEKGRWNSPPVSLLGLPHVGPDRGADGSPESDGRLRRGAHPLGGLGGERDLAGLGRGRHVRASPQAGPRGGAVGPWSSVGGVPGAETAAFQAARSRFEIASVCWLSLRAFSEVSRAIQTGELTCLPNGR